MVLESGCSIGKDLYTMATSVLFRRMQRWSLEKLVVRKSRLACDNNDDV
jgi:hypothetical protein